MISGFPHRGAGSECEDKRGRQRDTAYGVKWADSENGLGRGGEWVGPTERVGGRSDLLKTICLCRGDAILNQGKFPVAPL